MLDVMRFWLDKGVDGFRVDVIWHLIKDDLLRDNPPNPEYTSEMIPSKRFMEVYSADQQEVQDIVSMMRYVIDEYEHRREFLSQFPTIRTELISRLLAHPADPDTFRRCRLNPGERDNPFAVLFRDAAGLRRKDTVFSCPDACEVEKGVFNEQSFVLRLVKGTEGRRLIVNFGKSILVAPAAEPLLAPYPKTEWEVMFHTEEPAYGGGGLAQVETVEGWHLPAQCAVVLRSV